ncbi:ABC transporter permease [Variovorax sp. PCZ-1]|uniref:ABC transporter permease n=1 Tax=Variovorax sp. PCZ-1 TaxID=2835533 RepID=UPI001BCD8292|nr:ABC transporter permease [Variovorax sp. PCZ-1]MBS7808224.1 ABC transporter permease [Variovorax sp. PCZ-1]
MKQFPASPSEMLSSLIRNRELILVCVKREVQLRYKGSFLGIAWSFVLPLCMLAVYTFIFSEVFKARWNPVSDSKTEFALILFVGLIVFSIFSESISRAPSLIVSNVNYVKKVVFPLEILPWVIVANAVFHACISMLVWLAAYLLFFGLPHWTIVFLPIVILPLVFLVVGMSWFLSSLGVYLRDVGQFIGVAITALMFLSPIFFPLKAIPATYRYLFYANPLTPIIEISRDVLYWGKIPDALTLGIAWITSAVICWLGFAWFQKTRKGFADVL